MGKDKRFLCFEGQPLIDRAVALAAEVVGPHAGQVIVCGDVPGRECLPDRRPGVGPLAGLESGLIRARELSPDVTPWLLVIPVDMPRLDASILGRLTAAVTGSDAPTACAFIFDGFELPLLLSSGSRALSTLGALIERAPAKERSLRALERSLDAARLAMPAHLLPSMQNTNSPDDWEALDREAR